MCTLKITPELPYYFARFCQIIDRANNSLTAQVSLITSPRYESAKFQFQSNLLHPGNSVFRLTRQVVTSIRIGQLKRSAQGNQRAGFTSADKLTLAKTFVSSPFNDTAVSTGSRGQTAGGARRLVGGAFKKN